MAVQIYTRGMHYNQEDLNLLEFVSTQVAQAIERKRMDEEIRSLSLTDDLTGLYNRRASPCWPNRRSSWRIASIDPCCFFSAM